MDAATAAIEPKGPAYPNGSGAACWTALSPDGKTLYTGNFVGNSISAYAVMPDGTLSLLGTVARREAMNPDTKDIEISPDGKYLYATGPIVRRVAIFAIGADRLPRASCRPAYRRSRSRRGSGPQGWSSSSRGPTPMKGGAPVDHRRPASATLHRGWVGTRKPAPR